MHHIILSDWKFQNRIFVTCTLNGRCRSFQLRFLRGQSTRIMARSFEFALGFLCSRKLNGRIVVKPSASDSVDAFDDLLDRRAMRLLQSFVALGSVFDVVCDDLHDFLARAAKKNHDSCWCGGLGPALLDRGAREL